MLVYEFCSHGREEERTFATSILEIDLGGSFIHKFPIPRTTGCEECRAAKNFAAVYRAVPVVPSTVPSMTSPMGESWYLLPTKNSCSTSLFESRG